MYNSQYSSWEFFFILIVGKEENQHKSPIKSLMSIVERSFTLVADFNPSTTQAHQAIIEKALHVFDLQGYLT